MTPPKDAPPAILEALRSQDPIMSGRLGYGAFVGIRYPYLYIETPKVACTTTKVHLWNLEGLGPLPYPNFVHTRPPDDRRLSLLTAGEARAVEAMCGPSVFRFCVWRDPVRRLASTYMAKIQLQRDPRPEWNQARAAIVRLFGLTAESDITFDHFARFACGLPDKWREIHFMSQRRLTLAKFIR
jgi:hypothetical protein